MVGYIERITIGLNRKAIQANRVNPLYIRYLGQIHTCCFHREAMKATWDLLWARPMPERNKIVR
jgi:hypothetical protein